MRSWMPDTFGRACSQVAAFAIVIAVLDALLQPHDGPERAFGQVLGYGLVTLAIMVFKQRGVGLGRLSIAALGLVAVTMISGAVSTAVLSVLL